MLAGFANEEFVVEGSGAEPLERVLKRRYPEASWGALRKLITTGKVYVNEEPENDGRTMVPAGSRLALRMAAPRTNAVKRTQSELIAYLDAHVLVTYKPVGISSVRAEDSEELCLQERLERHLRVAEPRGPHRLHVVHRLDKVTSGVMIFARSTSAQSTLKEQFRAHTTGRLYDAVVHGQIEDQTLSFRMVRDRGDGLRGVTRQPNAGYHSVTHVRARQRLRGATLIECRLETGRTHQIRIHLAHVGHPIVGETLYTRDYPGPWLASERTLLHARLLSFDHPVFRKRLSFEQPLPAPFADWVAAHGGRVE